MANEERPQAMVQIDTFPGLNLETDEVGLSDGSTHEQVNCASDDVGTLRSRAGFRRIAFEGE